MNQRRPDVPPRVHRTLGRALDKLAYSYRQQTTETEGVMLTRSEASALYEAFQALADPGRRKPLPPL